jgi:hypothetical protein
MVVPSSIHHLGFDGVADSMPGGGRRPYAQKTIGELEAIFAQATRGSQAQSDLVEELRFRSTYRATRLQARVAAAYPDASQTASPDHSGRSAQTPAANKPSATKRTPRPAPSPVVAQPKVEPSAAGPADPPASRPKATTPPRTPNEPGAILSTWIALEALSPQTYRRPEDRAGGDRRCVADLGGARLPWQSGERSRPKKQLYYQIYLGAILMDRATDRLTKAFGVDEERGNRIREKAALAALLVDKNGCLLEDKAIAISSFGWALPLALEMRLGDLGAWPSLERHLIERLDKLLRHVDADGNPIPLGLNAISAAHRWLMDEFGLPDDLVEPPSFAIRVYHYFKAKNPPEVSLLNSFYLGDLARAQDRLGGDTLPIGLKRYLAWNSTRTSMIFCATNRRWNGRSRLA